MALQASAGDMRDRIHPNAQKSLYAKKLITAGKLRDEQGRTIVIVQAGTS